MFLKMFIYQAKTIQNIRYLKCSNWELTRDRFMSNSISSSSLHVYFTERKHIMHIFHLLPWGVTEMSVTYDGKNSTKLQYNSLLFSDVFTALVTVVGFLTPLLLPFLSKSRCSILWNLVGMKTLETGCCCTNLSLWCQRTVQIWPGQWMTYLQTQVAAAQLTGLCYGGDFELVTSDAQVNASKLREKVTLNLFVVKLAQDEMAAGFPENRLLDGPTTQEVPLPRIEPEVRALLMTFRFRV